ncbi:hypothetical protein T484DRAFT_1931493 [Baffinella frigidus]|nr:hypothetical protein T484DRAFT_1931493 [Cryptophyta sp. CCMP2293]
MYRDLGMQVNELDIRNLIASADLDGNGVLSFDEFVKLVEAGGHCNTQAESDYDTLMAFMTMGGGEDMSGFVDATRLRQVVKDFDLTIDIDNLCKTIDINGTPFLTTC